MQWLSSTVIMLTFIFPGSFGAEDLRIQPFGGDVEEFVVAEDAVLQGGDDVLPAHAGIDGECFDSPLSQILDLVFH